MIHISSKYEDKSNKYNIPDNLTFYHDIFFYILYLIFISKKILFVDKIGILICIEKNIKGIYRISTDKNKIT